MEGYNTEKQEYRGWTLRVECHVDEHMGPPWEEPDGHGPVSDWTTRDKEPGEMVLHTDGRSRRYYDFAGAVKLARADGWDSEPFNKDGRETPGEQAHKAALADFKRLKGWCNDDWHWVGFTSAVISPDGDETEGESVWGFDDEAYMLEDAFETLRYQVDELIEDRAREWKEARILALETQLAEVWP